MINNLIVFDIDDTLTQSEVQHQASFINAMHHFGIKDINEKWEEYDHMTDSFILKENYERNLSAPFSLQFVGEFETRMTEAILKLPPVTEIAGAKKAIQNILSHPDWGLGFATGSFAKPALLKLQQASIPADPQLVVGSNAHYRREDIVQASINSAKEFYQVPDFQHIISVGDGLWDWQTAQNLGIHFMGFGGKFGNDFPSKNHSVFIKDWREFDLYEVIGKLGIQSKFIY